MQTAIYVCAVHVVSTRQKSKTHFESVSAFHVLHLPFSPASIRPQLILLASKLFAMVSLLRSSRGFHAPSPPPFQDSRSPSSPLLGSPQHCLANACAVHLTLPRNSRRFYNRSLSRTRPSSRMQILMAHLEETSGAPPLPVADSMTSPSNAYGEATQRSSILDKIHSC